MRVNVRLLKTVLFAKKITQRKLSKKTGVSETYISKIMHEEYGPSKELFNRIIKAIGVKEEHPIYHKLIYFASLPTPRVRQT